MRSVNGSQVFALPMVKQLVLECELYTASVVYPKLKALVGVCLIFNNSLVIFGDAKNCLVVLSILIERYKSGAANELRIGDTRIQLDKVFLSSTK